MPAHYYPEVFRLNREDLEKGYIHLSPCKLLGWARNGETVRDIE